MKKQLQSYCDLYVAKSRAKLFCFNDDLSSFEEMGDLRSIIWDEINF